jgi:hypothetical protein
MIEVIDISQVFTSVDEYLENNFQLPEDIMAMAREDPAKKQALSASGKQTLPEVVFVLCDEALDILNRHNKLGTLCAELLLKLASYCAIEAEAHLRCRWGEGAHCYSGEPGDDPRWERTSVSKLKFNPLRNKEGDSMIAINTHNRVKKLCALLGVAASVGSLDPATRVDVAVRCARICLNGVAVGLSTRGMNVYTSRKRAHSAQFLSSAHTLERSGHGAYHLASKGILLYRCCR